MNLFLGVAAALAVIGGGYLALRLRAAERELQKYKARHDVDDEEHARLTALVRRRDRDLEEFFYAAGHDLRTPIRKILTFSDYLAQDAGPVLPDAARGHLKSIVSAAVLMEDLLQELLVLSRVGRQELNLEAVSLQDAVREAVSLCERDMTGRSAELVWENLPQIIWGDRALITDLYRRLIENAFIYSKERHPRIELTSRDENGKTVLGIKDHGVGFDPKRREWIFEPFKRLHSKKEIPGNGIGLAICRRIAERHGGTIWAQSYPGQGAHFQFTLGEESTIFMDETTPSDSLVMTSPPDSYAAENAARPTSH